MTYIAFLRGINVGGRKKIKMTDLKNMFEELCCNNVKTYIQSGNVIFNYNISDTVKLADKIEQKILETFGFNVITIIRTYEELQVIIDSNPLIKETGIDPEKLYITLLKNSLETNHAILDANKQENERFYINSGEVYLYCPYGYGRTKLNNAAFEKKLKTAATTRNWKVVNDILKMSKDLTYSTRNAQL